MPHRWAILLPFQNRWPFLLGLAAGSLRRIRTKPRYSLNRGLVRMQRRLNRRRQPSPKMGSVFVVVVVVVVVIGHVIGTTEISRGRSLRSMHFI